MIPSLVTRSFVQEILRGLRPRTPVALEPEPSNAYDPSAIKISLLNGIQIGYVPRQDTHIFPEGKVTFGRVASVGESTAGTLGKTYLVAHR